MTNGNAASHVVYRTFLIRHSCRMRRSLAYARDSGDTFAMAVSAIREIPALSNAGAKQTFREHRSRGDRGCSFER